MRAEKYEQRHDERAAGDVPPDAEIAEPRGETYAEDVDGDLGDENQDHHEQLKTPARSRAEDRYPRVGRQTQETGRRADQVDGGRDVDAGGDRDLADQVEPRRREGPAAPTQPEGPEVEAAGGRVQRGQLGHARGDREREQAHDRPADRVDDRASELQSVAEEKNGARE